MVKKKKKKPGGAGQWLINSSMFLSLKAVNSLSNFLLCRSKDLSAGGAPNNHSNLLSFAQPTCNSSIALLGHSTSILQAWWTEMDNRSHVPKFGDWNSEDNVPYTVYFDKARKDRTGGKMINPNDPQENPDMFPNMVPSAQAAPLRTRSEPEEPIGRGAVRSAPERRTSREDGDPRQFTESPARNDNMGRRASGESAHQRNVGRGSGSGRPVRSSAGSEHSLERSPLHPHYQAKVAGKGSASPGWEGKNSYDSSHGTPGRSRMKPANQGDETPDRGAAVPKFGEWDENNPASADGFTHIFNKVREERYVGSGKSPGVGNEPSYTAMRKKNKDNDAKGCCFPWCRK